MRTPPLIRWLGSMLIGATVVYMLLLAGLHFSGWSEQATISLRKTRPIDLLSEVDRVRFKDDLGLDQRKVRSAPPPPPPVVIQRQVSGFVQLEIEVGTSGEVLEARVLGAVPQGYYENQALQEVRLRRYDPAPIGRYRKTEVVPFTVTADAPTTDSAETASDQ